MNRFVGLIVTAALLAMPVSAYALTLKKGETLGSDGMVQGAGWGIYGANTSGLERLFTNPESPDLKKHSIGIGKAADGHPIKSGDSSIRFEVRPGDCGASSGFDCNTNRERVEYEHRPTDNTWFHWSLYIPKDAPDLESNIVTMGQFEQQAKVRAAQITILMFKYDGVAYSLDNMMIGFSGSSETGSSIVSTDKAMRGNWTDVLVNVNWSSGTDGFFKVYANGSDKALYKYFGPTKSTDFGVAFKFGIYRQYVNVWKDRGGFPTQVVYYDDVGAGKSCEEVTSYFDCNAIAKNFENTLAATIKVTNRSTKYDRTAAGMQQRFDCLSEYAMSHGIKGLPSQQEITALISKLENNDHYRSHRIIVKSGITQSSMDANKAALIRLVNYEGTNEEYCAKPVL